MDKLQRTGQNLGRVFNFINGRVHAAHILCYRVKLPNLKLKTRPEQLLGYLLLDIMLRGQSDKTLANTVACTIKVLG
jgi:hypothetical protein